MSFIECERVVKAYRVAGHELVALRGIDFTMEQGEMVAIIGPSGAGKSSLLNLLGGLDRPTAGQLRVDGQNLLELNDRRLARYRLKQVGFLWQQIDRNLLAHRSALRNVTLPMSLAGMSLLNRGKRARELLRAVDLEDQSHKRPVTLSGGQQQRVAVAVALANHPPLLLADEPTGALDRKTAGQVMQLLLELRERYGLTILMVTHDMTMAGYADRVLTLRDGALGQDISDADEIAPTLDEEGRVRLPRDVHKELAGNGRISVEIRPEGVLLRREDDAEDDTDELLRGILPQDAPPRRTGILSRIRKWWGRQRMIKGRRKKS